MKLKLFATLFREASQQGLSRQLWLWSAMRAFDANRQGWINWNEFLGFWPQTNRNATGILYKGQGAFWHFDQRKQRVFLAGVRNVAEKLETTIGQPILVEWKYVNTLRKFKAYSYSAFFAGKHGRTLSRQSLQRLYGVSRQTLRAWEKIARVETTRNIARRQVRSYADYEKYDIPGGGPKKGVYYKNGFAYWDISNTYSLGSRALVAPRHRRDDKHLRQTLKLTRANVSRVYYQNETEAYKALNRGKAQWAFVKTQGLFAGRAVWDHC